MSHALVLPALPVVHLLCVEDNPDDVALTALALERADPTRRYRMDRVEDERSFLQALHPGIDVVLCDFNLPGLSPYAVLDLLRDRGAQVPVVVLTRAIGEEAAVDVLRSGAKDYVTKDRLGTLPQVIARVMAERQQQLEKDRMAAELQGAYRRLQALSARVVASQEVERNHISRELHDELGQALAGMMMHLHVARLSPDAEQARRHTDTALTMAQGAIGKLKAMSFSLRPAQLDLLGLAATIETALAQAARPSGLEFEFSTRGSEPAAVGDSASAAVRLVQEAVSNVVQHARATCVRVRLRFLAGARLGLLVVDDGVGFDKERFFTSTTDPRHVGLHALIERTELAGGRVQIRTSPGCGVAIRALL